MIEEEPSPPHKNSDLSFRSLGLCRELLVAVEQQGYRQPTPVQAAAIPVALAGKDLWASAQTGSGKTAAFLLPLLQDVEPDDRQSRGGNGVFALILSPTRELAAQTADTLQTLAASLPDQPKIALVVGGVSINTQMLNLRGGADFVVATPGRLLDLIDKNAVDLRHVSALVLDEADRLLSLGFSEELARIMDLLPARCQKLLFSATFPAPVRALAEAVLHEPVAINIDAGATPDASAIAQRVLMVDESRRTMLLRALLKSENWTRTMVFVASKYAADHLAEKLRRAGHTAEAFSANLSQTARTQTLADFKAGKIEILIATDLAARGIDVEDLDAVVNFDLPRSAADYLHRIGRTGRAGQSGVALSFVSPANAAHFALIERRNNVVVPRETMEGFEPSEVQPPVQQPGGGVKGKRKSKKDKLREAAAQVAANGDAADRDETQ